MDELSGCDEDFPPDEVFQETELGESRDLERAVEPTSTRLGGKEGGVGGGRMGPGGRGGELLRGGNGGGLLETGPAVGLL